MVSFAPLLPGTRYVAGLLGVASCGGHCRTSDGSNPAYLSYRSGCRFRPIRSTVPDPGWGGRITRRRLLRRRGLAPSGPPRCARRSMPACGGHCRTFDGSNPADLSYRSGRRPSSVRSTIPDPGWGGRIRTCAYRDQNPGPYRLATPHFSGISTLRLWALAPDLQASVPE